MDRALLVEEKNEVMMRRGTAWKDRGGTSRFRDPGDFGSVRRDGEKRATVNNEKHKGKKLIPSELEERSKKGLCFKCGDKWNREHICKFKHMNLRLCEGSSDEEEEEEFVAEVTREEGEREELKTLQLSLQSKEGFTVNPSEFGWK